MCMCFFVVNVSTRMWTKFTFIFFVTAELWLKYADFQYYSSEFKSLIMLSFNPLLLSRTRS